MDQADEKIAIVSIFGKSAFDDKNCKASTLELMLGRKLFNRDLVHSINVDETSMVCYINFTFYFHYFVHSK